MTQDTNVEIPPKVARLLLEVPVELGRDLIHERLLLGADTQQFDAVQSYLENPENTNPSVQRESVQYIFEYLDNEGLRPSTPFDINFILLTVATVVASISVLILNAIG